MFHSVELLKTLKVLMVNLLYCFFQNVRHLFLKNWYLFIGSYFKVLGVLWLGFEAYGELQNKDINMSFVCFILLSIFLGFIYCLFDGYLYTGFFKNKIEIKSNSFNTSISVKFRDLFSQSGWKAIAVNDFFDGIVDDDLVSIKSLHGIAISKFWQNPHDWQSQIDNSLKRMSFNKEKRAKGNKKRYPIGTTAFAQKDDQKILFVALGYTDTNTNLTSATSKSLIQAVRGLLEEARTKCAGEELFIPLMGSGLSRVGIKNLILVYIILAAIFEETKQSKITEKITIVLPWEQAKEINLVNFKKDWN